MMAYDSRSTPEPRSLSAETMAALRDAATAQRPDIDVPNESLAEAVRRAANEAQSRTLRVEEVIVALKVLLDSVLPRPGAPPQGEDRLRERLITLLIKAYYGRE